MDLATLSTLFLCLELPREEVQLLLSLIPCILTAGYFCDAHCSQGRPMVVSGQQRQQASGKGSLLARPPLTPTPPLGLDPIRVSGNCFGKHCSPNASESPFPNLGATHQ